MTAREPVPPYTDLMVRVNSLEMLTYTGPETFETLSDLRQAIGAMREVIARMPFTREERTLGYVQADIIDRVVDRKFGAMLSDARLVGDIARQGERTDLLGMPEKVTLSDLGVDYDYGATVARFARLDDDTWEALIEDARAKRNASRAAFDRAAKVYLTTLDSIQDVADVRMRSEQNRHQHEVEQIEEFAASEPPLDVPPLTAAELSIAGAGGELRAVFDLPVEGEKPTPPVPQDNSPEAREQRAVVNDILNLWRRLHEHTPHLYDDETRILRLHGARDAVKRLTNELAVWMRVLNARAEEERDRDGNEG